MWRTPQGTEGLHVDEIASKLEVSVDSVVEAGQYLLSEGLIYTTVDERTWAVLEY
jgi:replication factor A2